MKKFQDWCGDVVNAMVVQGWGPSSAKVEIETDSGYLEELHAEKMPASEAAGEVIRQANRRQMSITV